MQNNNVMESKNQVAFGGYTYKGLDSIVNEIHTYHFTIATGSNFTYTNILIDHLVTIFILNIKQQINWHRHTMEYSKKHNNMRDSHLPLHG